MTPRKAKNPKSRGLKPSFKSRDYEIYGGHLFYTEDRGWHFTIHGKTHFLGMQLSAPAAKKKARAITSQNPKKPHTKKHSRKAATKKRATKKRSSKKTGKRNPLRGKAKAAFLKRMASGRRKAAKGAKKTSRKRSGNPTRNAKRSTSKRRRNQSAERMFETFHQRAPGKIVTYEELVRYPDSFAELGRLLELRCALDSKNRNFPITGFGSAQVVCTPDGRNIYFVGGDQKLDLDALDIGGSKDMVELGPCTYIAYHTVKGFHDFKPTPYGHHFGEENGLRPTLAYDRLNKTLFLIGGDYRVERPGIVN